MSSPLAYKDFTAFKVDRPQEGLLQLWIDTGAPNNGITHENHREFSDVWNAIANEDDVRAVVVRGVNGTFCGGGDLSFLPPLVHSSERRSAVHDDIVALVRNMIRCPKPIVSAIDGLCSGGGLAVAIMADISVCAANATLVDAHVAAGLACGDHAAYWPLKMGIAKTKYHLLTATPINGADAERSGLVGLTVDEPELHKTALEIGARLAELPEEAVRLTKNNLNGWYQAAQPIFEQSAAFEALGFSGEHVRTLVKDIGE